MHAGSCSDRERRPLHTSITQIPDFGLGLVVVKCGGLGLQDLRVHHGAAQLAALTGLRAHGGLERTTAFALHVDRWLVRSLVGWVGGCVGGGLIMSWFVG